jgi:hypothetical protein
VAGVISVAFLSAFSTASVSLAGANSTARPGSIASGTPLQGIEKLPTLTVSDVGNFSSATLVSGGIPRPISPRLTSPSSTSTKASVQPHLNRSYTPQGRLPFATRDHSGVGPRSLRRRVVALGKFTLNPLGGYGAPPDPNMATNGTAMVTAYNGQAAMLYHFTNMSGANLTPNNVQYCGITGGGVSYYSCSDPSVLYDRQANRWILSYLAFNSDGNGNFLEGATVAVTVSKTSDPTDGFYTPTLVGTVTDGCLDQPRLAYTTDKVVVDVNYWNWNASGQCRDLSQPSTDIVVANKTEFYAGGTYHRTMVRIQGLSIFPTPTPSYEGTVLWEAPDWTTGYSQGAVAYMSGPENALQFSWYSLPIQALGLLNNQYDENEKFAIQPHSSVQIDAGDGRFQSAAFTGGEVWAASSQADSTNQFCPYFSILNIDNSGNLTYNKDFLICNPDGWNMYYPTITTTISHQSVLGVVDYSFAVGGIDASTQGFQLDSSQYFNPAGREVGGDSALQTRGFSYARWGDYNGCSYVAGTNPAQAVCVGQFAQTDLSNSNQALEVFTNKYS